MPQDNQQQQYTDAQLSDGTTLRFKGQLRPDEVRQKVAAYRQSRAGGVGGGENTDVQPPSQSLYDRFKGAMGIGASQDTPQDVSNPAAQPGAFQTTKGGQIFNANTPPEDVTAGEKVHNLLLGEANRLQGGVKRMEMEDLENAAKGQPNSRPNLLPRMMGSVYRTAADMTTPTGAALTAGIALANTNPITGIPVDAALAAHGGYGVYQHRQALKDYATTGEANPDELQAGLNSASEAVGGAAGTGAQVRALRAPPPLTQQNAAAQRALDPGWGKREGFQRDLATARPYLGGRGAKGVADVQRMLPGAKTEIYQPADEAFARIGEEPVQGPDGPTTYNKLEARRQELSAQLQGVQDRDPATVQLIFQQGKTPAALAQEQTSIESLLDARMQQEGVNYPLVRSTYGGVKGVERQLSGTNTLSEKPQPYGLGKAVSDISLSKPSTWLRPLTQIPKDIALRRPWFSGKPTDVDISTGLISGAPKPTFELQNRVPLGPQAPPEGVPPAQSIDGMVRPPTPTPQASPNAPPPVQPQFAIERIGQPGGETGMGGRGAGFILERPNVLAGNQGYAINVLPSTPGAASPYGTVGQGIAGLLPGPPGPYVPPEPPPPVPQVSAAPGQNPALFPDTPSGQAPSPTLGAGEVPNWPPKTPQWAPQYPPAGPAMTYPSSPTLPDSAGSIDNEVNQLAQGGKRGDAQANVEGVNKDFHTPQPTTNVANSPAMMLPGGNPPLPPPPNVTSVRPETSLENIPYQPTNPQEVEDVAAQTPTGSARNVGNVRKFTAQQDVERNVDAGLKGNRRDTAGEIREAHRAKLRPNASGESSASREATGRSGSEKGVGTKRVRIDTRSGRESPLIGVDAVDAKPGPYDEIVIRAKDGRETVLERGTKVQSRTARPY